MGGLGFDFRVIQIGHSDAFGSSILQRFSFMVQSCVDQALSLVTLFENSLRFLMTLEHRFK